MHSCIDRTFLIFPPFQIPITDRPNRDGDGVFLRNDGKEMPKDILEETRDFLWKVHDEANKFSKIKDLKEAPQSIGHYFQQRFNEWIQQKKFTENGEKIAWRKQYYDWFIKVEFTRFWPNCRPQILRLHS